VIENKRVVITGAAGQDGLLLGRMLSDRKNEVLAVVISQAQKVLAERYNSALKVIVLDSLDVSEIEKVLIDFNPNFIFHLGAKSSVADSWRLSK
jgi:GDPmannose 4,6-dehydratase